MERDFSEDFDDINIKVKQVNVAFQNLYNKITEFLKSEEYEFLIKEMTAVDEFDLRVYLNSSSGSGKKLKESIILKELTECVQDAIEKDKFLQVHLTSLSFEAFNFLMNNLSVGFVLRILENVSEQSGDNHYEKFLKTVKEMIHKGSKAQYSSLIEKLLQRREGKITDNITTLH